MQILPPTRTHSWMPASPIPCAEAGTALSSKSPAAAPQYEPDTLVAYAMADDRINSQIIEQLGAQLEFPPAVLPSIARMSDGEPSPAR